MSVRKKKNRNLLEDPRYADFVERYHADPLRFAVEVTGSIPSADQESLFQAITPENARVSVVSGTGTGKTAAFARIALWHLLCFPVAVYEGKVEVGSNTYIGAPFSRWPTESGRKCRTSASPLRTGRTPG
ncbi:MAG: DEAD/DEAH box helicase family protein [Candidatus Accumulibacter sp.]|jgi:hypothetical protein|nr:DEAD/DEAH box helicase family protein [Accumulibacter sp.]